MPRRSRSNVDFTQPRFMQISESHCGPAVIQMLLSNIGIEVTQEDVAEAGGATSLIELNGMRVDQLALAVSRLAPQAVFFYKDHSTIDELARIVIDYRTPVGVEWQGLFDDEDEEDEDDDEDEEDTDPTDDTVLEDSETEDEDYGHYSLVVQAYRKRRQLLIADPYKDYFSQVRIFDFDAFEKRWYDFNEVSDIVSGESILVEDRNMMFVVVRRNVLFPRRMGMRTF